MARVPAILVAIGAVLAAPIATAVGRLGDDRRCRNAESIPSEGNAEEVRAAMVCLINRERDRAGVRELEPQAKLRRAASRHSADMVRRGYFSHISPEGHDALDRVVAAGYARRGRVRAVGEDLRWGVGTGATAASAVRSWLGSASHRRILLSRRYRELGAGIALGAPVPFPAGHPAATYTVVLAARD